MKKIISTIRRFPVFLAFIVIVLIGIGYGIVIALWIRSAPTQAPAVSAQTPVQYQKEARTAYQPFVQQISSISSTSVATWPTTLSTTIQTTRNTLLGLRVPREMQTTHLTLVLLLDRWQRAAQGSVSDQKNIIKDTQKILTTERWVNE